MQNLYEKNCTVCGKMVPAYGGQAFNEKGIWRTYHNECWEKIRPPEVTPGVNVTLVNGEVHYNLVGYHEAYRFNLYRSLVKSPYSKELNVNIEKNIEKAISQIESLKNANFVVFMSKDTETAFNAYVAKKFEIRDEVKDRANDYRLREYQKEGVLWLASHPKSLLGDDMGLGKTIQILMAIPNNSPVVVVCPASLKHNWQKETAKWRPDIKTKILSGRTSFVWPKPGEMIITNYDILPDNITMQNDAGEDYLPELKCPENMVVIADEAQKLKGSETRRYKSFRQWFKNASITWMVTATPLLNRPQELWTILNAMHMAEAVYGSWENFLFVFNGYKSGWGYEWGRPRPEAGELLKRYTLRRTKVQVAKDIPAKTVEVLTCEFKLDKLTSMLCDEAMEALERDMNSQLTFEKLAAARSALAKAKIPALIEVVEEYEEAGEPLVVFSHHKFPLESVAKRDGWALITGDTSVEARNRIVENFQAGNLKGLAATIMAGGVGITLTYAANVVFVDQEWTPALNDQAQDRVCRIGQTRPVTIRIMEGGHPLDEMVNACIERKRDIINNSVELVNNDNSVYRPIISGQRQEVVENKRKITNATVTIKGKQYIGKEDMAGDTILARVPKNDMEKDAWAAIEYVNAYDWDHARKENDVGFSKFDGPVARAFLNRGPFLNDQEWNQVILLAHKYQRQSGFNKNNYMDKRPILSDKEYNEKLKAFILVFDSEEAAKKEMRKKFQHKNL